jgi:hypothetical protein
VCQAQVGDKVPHFRGSKEIRIGADAEWDASGAQAQRQRARLSVDSKQHCRLTGVLNLVRVDQAHDPAPISSNANFVAA